MSAILTWLLVLMTATLCVGIWIGPALLAVGVGLLEMFTTRPTVKLIGAWTFNVLTSSDIVSLPLFILMGELLFRTRLSQSLFSGIAPWMSFLPGRLFHTTVIGCSMFAAISGSSAATTQVVGRITLTELLRRGYDRGLAVGSLAGAGTLGFLIPPSIPMIIYAVLAEESLLRLFTAGFLPGFALAACFMGYMGLRTLLDPRLLPADDRSAWTWSDRFRSLLELGPVAFLILTVLGTMYAGIASPSEASAIGVLGALAVAAFQKTLTWKGLRDAMLGAVQTTCM
ncbi:MAG: TRAP transporter large permease subunit, partial [Reyranella sp.]|nr:TRAP transporter large permease subunit [Reyranella sp.]